MTFIFKNRTIFWDISKWNRGQTKWDGGSTTLEIVKVNEPYIYIYICVCVCVCVCKLHVFVSLI